MPAVTEVIRLRLSPSTGPSRDQQAVLQDRLGSPPEAPVGRGSGDPSPYRRSTVCRQRSVTSRPHNLRSRLVLTDPHFISRQHPAATCTCDRAADGVLAGQCDHRCGLQRPCRFSHACAAKCDQSNCVFEKTILPWICRSEFSSNYSRRLPRLLGSQGDFRTAS
jgi:hypothetical protein